MKSSRRFKEIDKALSKKANGTLVVIVLACAILTLSTLFYMQALQSATASENTRVSEVRP